MPITISQVRLVARDFLDNFEDEIREGAIESLEDVKLAIRAIVAYEKAFESGDINDLIDAFVIYQGSERSEVEAEIESHLEEIE